MRKIKEGEGRGSKTTRKIASRERSIVARDPGPRERLIRAYPPGLATNRKHDYSMNGSHRQHHRSNRRHRRTLLGRNRGHMRFRPS
jgi:hypothetical protein